MCSMEEDKQALFFDKLPDEQSEQQNNSGIRIYKTRWLMLFLFSLTTTLNAAMFVGLTPVVAIVAHVYNVKEMHIEMLTNMFQFIFVFVSLPSAYVMSRCGVRKVLTVAALCHVIASVILYCGGNKGKFNFIIVGQLFAATAYSITLQIPGRLSSIWFPLHERGIATSIGCFMNILGVAFGFTQSSFMIPASNDVEEVFAGIRTFFLSRAVFAFVTFVATARFYRENPPTPSSYADDNTEMGFFQALQRLIKDRDFALMAQGYGIYYGLYAAVIVIIAPLVTWQHGVSTKIEYFIGWMGFSFSIAAIIGCFLFGKILDRTSQHKKVAVVLNGGSMLLWLGFSVILTKTTNPYALFVFYTIYGMFAVPYFATGIEQAAEMTSPVPEGTSSFVILLLSNLYGFLLVLILGGLIQYNYPFTSICTVLGLYMLSTALVSLAKVELKRTESITSSMLRLSVSVNSSVPSK